MKFIKEVNGKNLTIDDLYKFLESDEYEIHISKNSLNELKKSSRKVNQWIDEGRVIYGITNSLGILKDKKLDKKDQDKFSRSTLLSHSTALGPKLNNDIVKLTLLIKTNQLTTGNLLGVTPELPQRYIEFINKKVTPIAHRDGSLGIGDLPPEAEIGLAIVGDIHGLVNWNGKTGHVNDIFPSVSISLKYKLKPGETLAVVSGNPVVSAGATYAVFKLEKLSKIFDASFSLFIEAIRAKTEQLDLRPILVRGLKGEIASAKRVHKYIKKSEWTTEKGRNRFEKKSQDRVQDSTILRATTNIHGVLNDCIDHLKLSIEKSINTPSGNPLLFYNEDKSDYDILHGGMWDSTHLGALLDYLNQSIISVASASQRRTSRLMSNTTSNGLPENLIGKNSGQNIGYAQVQATQISLLTKLRLSAYPASVLSIPHHNQDDYTSMANNALLQLLDNICIVEEILAIDLLIVSEAVSLAKDKMKELNLGLGSDKLFKFIRKYIKPSYEDRYFRKDILKMLSIIKGNDIDVYI